MSTRVDKGGPKFKPILKTKARPSTTPAPPDVRSRTSVEPSSSMQPPSFIPEHSSSVAPSSEPAQPAPNSVAIGRPSIPHILASSTRNTAVVPSARPVTIQPTRDTPAPVQSSPTQGGGATSVQKLARPVVSIASTTSAMPQSRGTPIALSRSTPGPSAPGQASTPALVASNRATSSIPTPGTSIHKGKKRAGGIGDESVEAGQPGSVPPTDSRGGVARKRPKLSIVQAEKDRVKPTRVIKRKKKATAEAGTTEGEDTSGAEVSKVKRVPRKKKTADENVGENTPADSSHPKPKRTRAKRKTIEESVETGPHDSESQAESASSSRKPKKRQQTENAEPEGTPEPIDPTQVTMRAICDDPGSGRMSSRWETSQTHYTEARKRAREERERAIAEAAEEERQTGRAGARKGVPRPTLPTAGEAGEESVANPDEFTYDETLQESHYAPQVRIGANGEVVLDVESLQVDRAADASITEDAYSFVEESDQSKFTNSNSWSRRRNVRWGKEDTAMFYYALRQFGQNFDLIARVLPGRTYRMCKNKFKAEDKKNPGLIDDALKNSVAVDVGTLSRMTGKDFSGPIPIILAKKVPDLGEHAETQVSDQAEFTANAPQENSTPGENEDQTGDKPREAEMDARQSESPPPIDSLLNGLPSVPQNASPTPPRSVPDAVGSVNPSSRPVTISTPADRNPTPVRQETQAASSAQNGDVTEPPPFAKKKKGGKTAVVEEEGVEVLGLAEDYVED